MSRLVGLALSLALLIPAGAAAQISPGPLARPHASLEGSTKCTQCHGTTKDAMPRLCLNCHKEVALLVSQGRGYHARDAKTSGKSCGSCHPDHAGRDFELIEWPSGQRDRFDHETAGWPLKGKHAPLPCADCHTTAYRRDPAARLSPRRGSAGWVGLEQACASCHASDDPHRESLGVQCADCHDEADWAPAPRFRHADSRYPLTGAHEKVDCNDCHLAPRLRIVPDASGKQVPRYRPLAFAECSSCHADPHQGRLSRKCGDCHVTEGFQVMDRRGFNHSLTPYPLLGKHRRASCESCHGQGLATPRPVATTCAACHADRHSGEATLAGDTVDCAACHKVEGFSPSTYRVAQHQTTRFPLNGKHATVSCASCHVTDSAGTASAPGIVHVRVEFGRCDACHANPHADQLPGQRCETCHGDAGWQELVYDRSSHGEAKLPLEGRHATLACSACHGPGRAGLPALASTRAIGSAGVHFQLTETRCAACHANPHADSMSSAAATTGCADCHTATAFRPATIGVDAHARFEFALDGAHRAVPCRDCHTGLTQSDTVSSTGHTLVEAATALARVSLRLSGGTACASCHETPHGDQFATRADSGRCESCHTSDRFVGALRFDHDRDAAFSLDGAHRTVRCAQCHRVDERDGVTVVRYRPVPTTCEGCHVTKQPGGPP